MPAKQDDHTRSLNSPSKGVAFLPCDRLRPFLEELARLYTVFVPVRSGATRHFRPYTDTLAIQSLDLCSARTVQPLKAFLFSCRGRVAEGFSPEVLAKRDRPICVLGAKACDLDALGILDTVFLDAPPTEPYYAQTRENALIIAADCARPLSTCFCTALEGAPYPTKDFDAAITELTDGWLVEVANEKGETMLSAAGELLSEAKEAHFVERDASRRRAVETVEANVREYGPPPAGELEGAVAAAYDAPVWEEEALRCVECGACNTICPTCHCFYLYEHEEEGCAARFRAWDSCLLKTFARVAGGDNPRSRLWMRLRNRFEKKFDFFPRVAGVNACTGCGRCITACPARIDIRHVLREVAAYAGAGESVPPA
ncbi:MAG: 4Fe-4S dicluster domain-containing protein [Candidatus Hydrogenedentota bacterium]